jgi:hypothetical protein
MLIPFIVIIVPTVLPAVSAKTTIIFVVTVKPPASIILTLIFIQEMLREGFTIPHVFHLLFSDITPVNVSGPVAWTGLLFFLTAVTIVILLIFAAVNARPSHIYLKREIRLTPRRSIQLHQVDAREGMLVDFHGKLSTN